MWPFKKVAVGVPLMGAKGSSTQVPVNAMPINQVPGALLQAQSPFQSGLASQDINVLQGGIQFTLQNALQRAQFQAAYQKAILQMQAAGFSAQQAEAYANSLPLENKRGASFTLSELQEAQEFIDSANDKG